MQLIYSLKLYNAMTFNIVTERVVQLSPQSNFRTFLSSQRENVYPLVVIPIFPKLPFSSSQTAIRVIHMNTHTHTLTCNVHKHI